MNHRGAEHHEAEKNERYPDLRTAHIVLNEREAGRQTDVETGDCDRFGYGRYRIVGRRVGAIDLFGQIGSEQVRTDDRAERVEEVQNLEKDVLVRPEQFDHPGICNAVDQCTEEADEEVANQEDPEDEGEWKGDRDGSQKYGDKAELDLPIPDVQRYCSCQSKQNGRFLKSQH